MSAILNSLNVHNFPIFQPILMKLVSKFMVYRPLSDTIYLLSGLLYPLRVTHGLFHMWYIGSALLQKPDKILKNGYLSL